MGLRDVDSKTLCLTVELHSFDRDGAEICCLAGGGVLEASFGVAVPR